MVTDVVTKFPTEFGIPNANFKNGISLDYFQSVIDSIKQIPFSIKEKDSFKIVLNQFDDVLLSYEKEMTPLDVANKISETRLAAIKEALQLLDSLKKGNRDVDLQLIISKLEPVANDS